MTTTREYTPGASGTIQILTDTLKDVEGWEGSINNPPPGSSEYKFKFTPDGPRPVLGRTSAEQNRIDGLEGQIANAKANALASIQKNNASLPGAESKQLYKDSITVLYSTPLSRELAADKNAAMSVNMDKAQERNLALIAKQQRAEAGLDNTKSSAIRSSFPDSFELSREEIYQQQLEAYRTNPTLSNQYVLNARDITEPGASFYDSPELDGVEDIEPEMDDD